MHIFRYMYGNNYNIYIYINIPQSYCALREKLKTLTSAYVSIDFFLKKILTVTVFYKFTKQISKAIFIITSEFSIHVHLE